MMNHQKTSTSSLLALSERVYRALLILYPADYRREYSRHMALAFRDICRDAYYENGMTGVVLSWVSTLLDLFITVIEERRREGFRMSKITWVRFSGLLLLFAGIFFMASAISQLQPGSHYSYEGIYQLSILALVPAFGLLTFGLPGIYKAYKDRIGSAGRAMLAAAIISAATTGLGLLGVSVITERAWNVFILALIIHLLSAGLFGWFAWRASVLKPWSIILTIVYLAMFALIMGLVAFPREGESYGPQLSGFVMLAAPGIIWALIGYTMYKEQTALQLAVV